MFTETKDVNGDIYPNHELNDSILLNISFSSNWFKIQNNTNQIPGIFFFLEIDDLHLEM